MEAGSPNENPAFRHSFWAWKATEQRKAKTQRKIGFGGLLCYLRCLPPQMRRPRPFFSLFSSRCGLYSQSNPTAPSLHQRAEPSIGVPPPRCPPASCLLPPQAHIVSSSYSHRLVQRQEPIESCRREQERAQGVISSTSRARGSRSRRQEPDEVILHLLARAAQEPARRPFFKLKSDDFRVKRPVLIPASSKFHLNTCCSLRNMDEELDSRYSSSILC
jgi:hypothetical protein